MRRTSSRGYIEDGSELMICRKCGGALPSDHDDPDPIHDDCHRAEVDELRLDDQMRGAGVNPPEERGSSL